MGFYPTCDSAFILHVSCMRENWVPISGYGRIWLDVRYLDTKRTILAKQVNGNKIHVMKLEMSEEWSEVKNIR